MLRIPFAWLLPAILLFSPALRAQDSTAGDDLPEWLFADSILVQNPPWISGTVARNIVIVSFRHGTTASRRSAIIRQIHGIVVYNDHFYGNDGDYFVRVADHPDACGVKQALEVLDRVPEVDLAIAHTFFAGSPDGGMTDVSATHKGSKQPCPAGTGLLK